MVLFAKASGWPIDSYWHPDHPVQRLALETISALSDVPIEEIATADDGCGVVCFGMPLRGLALAFARLADPSAVADPPLRSALTRIRDAMMSHPELVAGERRRIDTAIMRAYPEAHREQGRRRGRARHGPAAWRAANGRAARRWTDGGRRRRSRTATSPAAAATPPASQILRQLGLAGDPLPGTLAACVAGHPRPARRAGRRRPGRVQARLRRVPSGELPRLARLSSGGRGSRRPAG